MNRRSRGLHICRRRQGGVTAIEYALLAALISVGAILALQAIGTANDGVMRTIAAALSGSSTGGGSDGGGSDGGGSDGGGSGGGGSGGGGSGGGAGNNPPSPPGLGGNPPPGHGGPNPGKG